MIKLFVVRHGKTDWNELGLAQGSKDIELNEEGIKQAIELSKKIDLNKIDICICSPMKRTKKTAEIIVKNQKEIIYDNLIIERSFGNFEGKIINQDTLLRQWNYKLNDSSNNIESIQELLKRTNKFIEKIKETYKDKTILIISHACFIKTLHFCILGYDEETDFLSFFPKNTYIYEYEINEM